MAGFIGSSRGILLRLRGLALALRRNFGTVVPPAAIALAGGKLLLTIGSRFKADASSAQLIICGHAPVLLQSTRAPHKGHKPKAPARRR